MDKLNVLRLFHLDLKHFTDIFDTFTYIANISIQNQYKITEWINNTTVCIAIGL